MDMQAALLREREEDIVGLHSRVEELNGVFVDLGELVELQGENLGKW